MKDYYKILGILDDAEDIIIRAAYKALAQKYHPDKWRGDVNEANLRMAEINEAYQVLSDKDSKEKYDEEYFSNRKQQEESHFKNTDQTSFAEKTPHETSSKNKTPNDIVNSSNYQLIYIGLFLLIGFGITQIYPLFSSLQKSKTFKLTNCESCDKDGKCQPNNTYKEFKVEESDVVIFVNLEGKDQFFSLMSSEDSKCKIIKDKNFAFSCNDYKYFGGGSFLSTQYNYDGKSTFENKHSSSSTITGSRFNIQYQTTCQAN